jgi:restriction endonuclease S subunit
MPDVAKKRPKAGWTTVAFGDVVRQVKDKVDPEASGLERYVAGEHMDTDDLRIRRWGEIGDGYLGPAFHMRFKPGQVLYGSRRTYLRKVAVADFEGITANTTYVLESANPDVLLPELLPFIMQTEAFNQHSVRESKGSVNPYVNFSDLAWFEFTLPPIEEQRKLCDVLLAATSSSNKFSEAESAIISVQRSFLENELDPAKQGWRCATIGDLFETAGGGTPSRARPDYWGGDIPWLTTSEVCYEEITSTNESITRLGLAESSSRLIPTGSVVIAMFGATRARSAINAIELAMNQACIALLPNATVESAFAYAWTRREESRLYSQGRGAAQPNLNAAIVRAHPFPIVSRDQQARLGALWRRLEDSRRALVARRNQVMRCNALVMGGNQI